MRCICFRLLAITFSLLLAATAAKAQTPVINLQVLTPTTNQVTSALLHIEAKTPMSTYQIDSVIAVVQGNRYKLPYDATNSIWTGNMSLYGVTLGATTLTVTAFDAMGNTKSVNVPVTFHTPPVLSVAKPLNNSVARPYLPVKATCLDSSGGNCTITVAINSGGKSYSGTFINSVDTLLDLSAFPQINGMYVGIMGANYREHSR